MRTRVLFKGKLSTCLEPRWSILSLCLGDLSLFADFFDELSGRGMSALIGLILGLWH